MVNRQRAKGWLGFRRERYCAQFSKASGCSEGCFWLGEKYECWNLDCRVTAYLDLNVAMRRLGWDWYTESYTVVK